MRACIDAPASITSRTESYSSEQTPFLVETDKSLLTLSQTTNFRLFQTEKGCR